MAGKKTQADSTHHTILNRVVKKDSYATIIRCLNQLKNVTKDKQTKSVVKKDMEYLKKKYKK